MAGLYQELIKGDWLGRSESEYTYEKKGLSMGWESHLTQGEAFSTFIFRVNEKELKLEKEIYLTKRMCTSIMNRMLTNTSKRPKITFCNDFDNYAIGEQLICVTLEPLKKDNEIKFPSLNHKIDPILGYTAHEVAHILYTDSTYADHLRKFKGVEQRLKQSIMNILEDERIEKLIAENFRGYSNYVGKAKDYCFGKKYPLEVAKLPKNFQQEPVNELMGTFLHLLRYPRALSEAEVTKYEPQVREFMEILKVFPTTIPELIVATEKIYEVFLRLFKDQKNQDQQKCQQGQQYAENEPSKGQKSKAKAQSGGGNINSDKGEDGDSEEDADGQGTSGDDANSDQKTEKGDKGKSKDKSSGEESEESGDSSDNGSGSGNDSEESEESNSSGNGSSGEPNSSDTDGEPSSEGSENSNEDGDDLSEDVLTDEEAKELMSAVMEGVLKAIQNAQPMTGDSEEVSKMLKRGSVTKTIEQISQFDNSQMDIRHSATHGYPALRTMDNNEMPVYYVPKTDRLSTTNHYDESLARVKGYASSLRAKLSELNRNIEVTQTNLYEGSFDDGLLVDALIGAKNVYSETHRIQNRGVCVGLLIDESGSMGTDNRWMTAMDVAVMFERALDGLNNIDYFCYGHTTGVDGGFGGSEATVINTYFEGRKKGNRKDLGMIYRHGANRDGHAILEVTSKIRSQIDKEMPLVLFMISDGMPSSSIPSKFGYDQVTYTRECVKIVQKNMNTQVIHIAVHPSVRSEDMFDKYVKFSDLNTLVRDLGKILKKVVTTHQSPITL